MRFSEILTETVLNFFSPDEKSPYANDVFAKLTRSYARVGGIHGDGFKSPEDMVANIPMWKLIRRGDTIVAGSLYKDTAGRKRVASFTDGSDQGKQDLAKLILEEYLQGRSWGEVSDNMWTFIKNTVPRDVINSVLLTPQDVFSLAGQKLGPPDPAVTAKDPEYASYYYSRIIGGQEHTKIALGTPQQTITPPKK